MKPPETTDPLTARLDFLTKQNEELLKLLERTWYCLQWYGSTQLGQTWLLGDKDYANVISSTDLEMMNKDFIVAGRRARETLRLIQIQLSPELYEKGIKR